MEIYYGYLKSNKYPPAPCKMVICIEENDIKHHQITKYKTDFNNVGEFQNLNLFVDEKDDVYLFGMGNEGINEELCPIVYIASLYENDVKNIQRGNRGDYEINFNNKPLYSQFAQLGLNVNDSKVLDCNSKQLYLQLEQLFGYYQIDKNKNRRYEVHAKRSVVNAKLNVCRIYKVEGMDDEKMVVRAVYINSSTGVLNYADNHKSEENKVAFNCKEGSDPRFNWASCLHIDQKDQKKGKGFLGELSLYTVGRSVHDVNYIDTITFKEDEQ